MDLYTKLTSCMEDLSATFSTRMTQYEEDLKNASSEPTHKTIASLSKDFNEFKGLIWRTMTAIRSQMELLVVAVDRHEMASRGKVLLLHGLSEEKEENVMSKLIQNITQKIQLANINPKDITACHRLGKDSSKPRPLLVRFESRILRSEVWRNKTKLKGSGLTFSEFLTKPRHDVFISARKYYGMNKCWTSEGKIVIQVTDKTRRKIESASEFRELMAQFPVDQSTPHNIDVESSSSATSPLNKRARKPVK